MKPPDSTPPTHAYERPSKSQLKRDMTALQKLGVQLLALPLSQFKHLDLPESLRDAIELARKITSHEGRRRQLQLIGKLMRMVDAEPIQQAIAKMNGEHRAEALRHHAIEHWRDQLVAADPALSEFRARFPTINFERLQRLVNEARSEQAEQRPLRANRELFRLVRDTLEPGVVLQTGSQDVS
jgi:ribosome-associated protein